MFSAAVAEAKAAASALAAEAPVPESSSPGPLHRSVSQSQDQVTQSPSSDGDCLSSNEGVPNTAKFLIRRMSDPDGQKAQDLKPPFLKPQPFQSTLCWSDPIVQATLPFLDGNELGSDLLVSDYCTGHGTSLTGLLSTGVPFHCVGCSEKKDSARKFLNVNLGAHIDHCWRTMADQSNRSGHCETCGCTHNVPVTFQQPHCGLGSPPCQSVTAFRTGRFAGKAPATHPKYQDLAGGPGADGSFVESCKVDCPLGIILEEPHGFAMKSEEEARSELEVVKARLCQEILDIRRPGGVPMYRDDWGEVFKICPQPHIKNDRPRYQISSNYV